MKSTAVHRRRPGPILQERGDSWRGEAATGLCPLGPIPRCPRQEAEHVPPPIACPGADRTQEGGHCSCGYGAFTCAVSYHPPNDPLTWARLSKRKDFLKASQLENCVQTCVTSARPSLSLNPTAPWLCPLPDLSFFASFQAPRPPLPSSSCLSTHYLLHFLGTIAALIPLQPDPGPGTEHRGETSEDS